MKADDFRTELRSQLRAAELRGAPWVEINSGDLHRKVGGYPAKAHAMPTCCDVMWEERKADDVVVSTPPKGKGASLTIRYALPRKR